MTTRWHIEFTAASVNLHPDPADDDHADTKVLLTLQDALGDGAVRLDGDGTLIVFIPVEAATLEEAETVARAIYATATRAAFGHAVAYTGHTGVSSDQYLRMVAIRDIAGVAEVADMLGVTPARIGQLNRENPRFPAPLKKLKAGSVYDARLVELYQQTRRNGRPSKDAG